MSKNGFSYYKAETDRFQDIKIKRLKKKYGCDGYADYQYALNEIYGWKAHISAGRKTSSLTVPTIGT